MTTDFVVELTAAPEAGELAALDLWDRGATALEWRQHDEVVTLIASFPTPDAAREVAVALGAALREIPIETWRDTWQAWAQPVDAGGIVVVPAWRHVDLGPQLGLSIDPGGCFGSGTHPSTRLLLSELVASPPAGQRVLDVGSGSGILSIAAALLGADSAFAIDIDPDAVAIGQANATRNGVGDRIGFASTAVDALTGTWDLALVNVTAGVHAAVAPTVVTHVRAGGRLLLAGLLPGQWRHVAQVYRGTVLIEELELDGWVGAVLDRR